MASLRDSALDKEPSRCAEASIGSQNGLPRVGGATPAHAEIEGSGKISEKPGGGFISVSCTEPGLVAIEIVGMEIALTDMAVGVVTLDIVPMDIGVPASIVRMRAMREQTETPTNGM